MNGLNPPKISLELELLPNSLAICRLSAEALLPDWATQGSFYSASKTKDEFSIVCDENNVPENIKAEKNWKCLKVKGPLDFGLTGILASLANPLSAAGISIFAISTFDTDYLLIKQTDLDRALVQLQVAGHRLEQA